MLSRVRRPVPFIGHTRARTIVVAGGVLLGLVVACAAIWLLIELRHKDISDNERELKNTALILAEEIESGFQAAELIELNVIEHMRQQGIDSPEEFARQMGSRDEYELLKERIGTVPILDGITLIDAHGRIINVSRTWPPPDIRVSGTQFLTAFSTDPTLTTYISAARPTQGDGSWSILFTLRFSASNGGLLGFVSARMDLTHFEQTFSRIMLDRGGSFSLFHRDGMLLARYPHVDTKIGQSFGGTTSFSLLGPGDGQVVRMISDLDGQDRLVAPRVLKQYPLLVGVTVSTHAILAAWRTEVLIVAATTAAFELLIAGAVLLMVRDLSSYEALKASERARAHAEGELALAAERERSARALQIQGQRFDTALNHMFQGLLMFDHAGRLLVVNRRFCELFGVPLASLPPGTPSETLTKRVLQAGTVTPKSMKEIREHWAILVERNARATTVWELENGRTFAVIHQPMEEGWLSTFEEITERRQTEARMAHLARHDSLTELPNRVLFREKLEDALAYARRGRTVALLYLDLDQFKEVNDTLGHPVGDALLQAVAGRLSANVRETDTVARLGGDEFAIVQAPIEKPTEATALARRLNELLDEPFEVDSHQIVIGTSIGIVFAPQDGLDPDQLMRSADLALYRAKVDGRGIYRLFHTEMDAQMQARRLLELDLRQALRSGQLEMFYQPLVDVTAGAVTGFETLMRWRQPERGIVPASEFIPLAEEIGLIIPSENGCCSRPVLQPRPGRGGCE